MSSPVSSDGAVDPAATRSTSEASTGRGTSASPTTDTTAADTTAAETSAVPTTSSSHSTSIESNSTEETSTEAPTTSSTTSSTVESTSSIPTTSSLITTSSSSSVVLTSSSIVQSTIESVTSATAPTLTLTSSVTRSTQQVAVTSAADKAGSSKKSNTGAIAGGVVGGIVGAALLGALLYWFCARRKRKDDAFDDSMFDPHHSMRHSQVDPMDSLTPTTPNMGMLVEEQKVEPYQPYEEPMAHMDPSYGQYNSHLPQSTMEMQQMQMPDARNYMGSYNSFNNDSPYGAAAFAGVGVPAGGHADYMADPYAAAPGGVSPAVAARMRDQQMDRPASPESNYTTLSRGQSQHHDQALSSGHGDYRQ